MANEIFIDSSGFFAMLVESEDQHVKARNVLEEARRRKRCFVTTDYVLDETVTLLVARRLPQLVPPLFDAIEASRACRIEWTDAERFHEVRRFVLKHSDQTWSFTDCLSFLVMKQFRLRDALTRDKHFQQAGLVSLLL